MLVLVFAGESLWATHPISCTMCKAASVLWLAALLLHLPWVYSLTKSPDEKGKRQHEGYCKEPAGWASASQRVLWLPCEGQHRSGLQEGCARGFSVGFMAPSLLEILPTQHRTATESQDAVGLLPKGFLTSLMKFGKHSHTHSANERHVFKSNELNNIKLHSLFAQV